MLTNTNPASNPELYYLSLNQDCVPDPETIEKDLTALSKKYLSEFKKFLRERTNFVYVDYIHIEEAYRRQGVGTKLYNLGAMWLAVNRNLLLLCGSSIQSDSAKAVWASMISNDAYPIVKIVKKSVSRFVEPMG